MQKYALLALAIVLLASLAAASAQEEVEVHLRENLGPGYYSTHFSYSETKIRGRMECIVYDYSYGSDSTEMTLCYDTSEGKIAAQMSSFISHPQEILFDKNSADLKATELGLPFPRDKTLIYFAPANTLAWKILWRHTPTKEERVNNVVEGFVISAADGSTLDTYNFHITMGPDLIPSDSPEVSLITKIISFMGLIRRFLL